MAQKHKKSRDEEIIDLTEVIEEGDPELAKSTQDPKQDPDDDFDDDLNDLFGSLDPDEDDHHHQENDLDKEFEDLFKEHSVQEAGPEDKPWREQAEASDFMVQETDSREDKDKVDFLSEDPDLEDLFGDQDFEQGREKKIDSEDDPFSEPESESPAEEYPPDVSPARETSAVDNSAPGSVEHLTQQMENMQELMEKLQTKMNLAQEEFAGRVLQTLEEKGYQLGFIQEMIPGIVNQAVEKGEAKIQEQLDSLKDSELQDIQSRLAQLEEKAAGIQIPDIQELQDALEQKIDQKIQSALAYQKDNSEQDPGFEDLKQELHQDLENRIQESLTGIADSTTHKITERLQQEMDSLRQNELRDFASRVKTLEEQVGSMDTFDIQSLRDELEQKINQAFESAKTLHQEPPDLTGLKEEVIQSVEVRIQELESNWQSEKKSLAAELENALTFWGGVQEKLTELSRDIGELKDRGKQPDPELQERINSLYQTSVSREDLHHLASQLRHELKEHMQKQVPAEAARVIREEIMAMLQEERE